MINQATLPRGIKLTQFSPNSMTYREPALLLVEIIVIIVMIIIVEVIMVMGIAVIVVVHCVQGFNVPQRIGHRVVVMLVRSVPVIRVGQVFTTEPRNQPDDSFKDKV